MYLKLNLQKVDIGGDGSPGMRVQYHVDVVLNLDGVLVSNITTTGGVIVSV